MNEKMKAFLESQGYRNLSVVKGVLVGTQDYLTTRAIEVGITEHAPGRRYCFQDRAEADVALATYTDPDKHPNGAWIKLKGRYRGEWVDAMNPAWPDIQSWDEVAPHDE